MRTHSPALHSRDDIESLLASDLRHIRATNYPPKAVSTYSASVRPFFKFLRKLDMMPSIDQIGRANIEAFITAELSRSAAATVSIHQRGPP